MGADPNVEVQLDDTLSPLARAARNRHLDVVKMLIANGARVDEELGYTMGHGWFDHSTALIWACRSDSLGIVKTLIASRANPNAQEIYYPNGNEGQFFKGATPLVACESLELLKVLLKAGAKPNECASDGLTPLMKFSAMGKIEEVTLLIKSGADPALKDKDGKTARDIAQSLGHTEIVRLLKSE